MNWWVVILIIVILVTADKAITYANLKLIQRNSPGVNPIDAEKNPAARWTFQHFGLEWGTIIYFFVTVISLLFVFVMFSNALKFITFTSSNPYGYALYGIVLIYSLVIGNNFYFMFRYAKLI